MMEARGKKHSWNIRCATETHAIKILINNKPYIFRVPLYSGLDDGIRLYRIRLKNSQ